MNIGALLRYYRKLKNLSQNDLAELADVNEKYYSKIERDENNPTYAILNRIVNALDMKMTQFSIAADEYCSYDYLFFPENAKSGVFIREVPPRFVAEVQYQDRLMEVYVASSFKLSKRLNLYNSKVNLLKIEEDSRFKYSIFSLDHNTIKIILNLNVVNKLFYELYCTGMLSGYHWYGVGKPEVTCLNYKTDFYFEQEKIVIENKTIVSENASCSYPIEKSKRIMEQLKKIEELLDDGYNVRINFFILTPWTNKIWFEKDFENAMDMLKCKGMKEYVYYMYYEKDILRVQRAIFEKTEDEYCNIKFYNK